MNPWKEFPFASVRAEEATTESTTGSLVNSGSKLFVSVADFTLGTNVGFISLLYSLTKSRSAKNTLPLTASMSASPWPSRSAGFSDEKLLEKIFCPGGNEGRYAQVSLLYQLVHEVDIFRVERGQADEHLVEEDAQGPPVDVFSVAYAHDDLGREVLGSAAKRLGLRARLVLLGETKVGEAHVACVIKQNIFGLQVAVDDILRMQVTKAKRDFSCVKLRAFLVEPALVFQVKEKLPARKIVHNDVELRCLGLECVVKLHEER